MLFSRITQIESFVGNVSKQSKGWEASSRHAHWSSEVSQVDFEGGCQVPLWGAAAAGCSCTQLWCVYFEHKNEVELLLFLALHMDCSCPQGSWVPVQFGTEEARTVWGWTTGTSIDEQCSPRLKPQSCFVLYLAWNRNHRIVWVGTAPLRISTLCKYWAVIWNHRTLIWKEKRSPWARCAPVGMVWLYTWACWTSMKQLHRWCELKQRKTRTQTATPGGESQCSLRYDVLSISSQWSFKWQSLKMGCSCLSSVQPGSTVPSVNTDSTSDM